MMAPTTWLVPIVETGKCAAAGLETKGDEEDVPQSERAAR